MEDWPLPKMETYMKGLKEGKEKTVLLACIKRKEGRKISTIANEMRKSPDTVRGWLARGRDRGLYDLDDHKPPGRAPMLDHMMVETIRGWMSKPPTEFGYMKKRWQCKMVQETIRKKLNVSCSADTVRSVMHHMRFSYRKSRPAPHKSASEEEQKGFKERTGALLARLALLGYLILSLDEASCMVGGWNGYGMAARRRPRDPAHKLVKKGGAPDRGAGGRLVSYLHGGLGKLRHAQGIPGKSQGECGR